MRIAQFIDTASAGGAETVVLDLCRQLRDQALEPVLFHFGSDYLDERARYHGIEQHLVPGWRQYKSVKTLPSFMLQFRRFLRQQHIDVLHSHLYGPVTAAAPASLLAGIPHIGTLHDVYVVAERPTRIHLLQAAALLGTRLVCVSKHMERYYRQQAHFSQRALQTIYNGTPSTPAAASRRLRQALGLQPEHLVITCVSRLVSLKNHHLLLHAFSRLAPELSARLLLVGDGPLEAQLRQWSQQLGLQHRVHFLGRRSDVPEILASSDLFALTSDTEGLSCSILEAMSAGLPTVATAVGGNPELIIDGETGFLIAPGDEEALYLRLQTLARDPALRQQFGQAARQRATTLFSLDAMLEGYLRLYPAPTPTVAAAGRRE